MYCKLYHDNIIQPDIKKQIKKEYLKWSENKEDKNKFSDINENIGIKFKVIEIFDYGVKNFVKLDYLYIKNDDKISTQVIYNIDTIKI